MDNIFMLSIVLMSAAAGFNASMWMLWRSRAIDVSQGLTRASSQVQTAKDVHNNLADERKLQLEALQEVFEYLNDQQGEFTSLHNEKLMELRNTVLHAIQNSTYRG